ncbi:MAG TPA: hypothetical protein VFH68_10530 [Polyangia bacterium]|nr:hypothetical protein [Polyangia bacterium]
MAGRVAGVAWGMFCCMSALACDRAPTEPWSWTRSYPVGHGPAAPGREAAQSLPLRSPGLSASVRALQAMPDKIAGAQVDARILIIATNGQEVELVALRQALGYLGAPFDVLVASTAPPLTADQLASGNHGKYNGVILTRGELVYDAGSGAQSALDPGEWDVLTTYEASFGVREAAVYVLPDGGYGLGLATQVDATVTPSPATCTAAGRAVFFDVSCDNPISIAGVWTYPAPVRDQATTTALLVDASGNALASVQQLPGGREALELSFGQSRFAVHTLQLLHGVVSWVTRGIFVGERQIYFGTQVDDLFIASNVYNSTPHASFRIGAADLQSAHAWQSGRRQKPTTGDIRLDMALNAVGTVQFAPDPLTDAALDIGDDFKWISHTYDHRDLTGLDYQTTQLEIARNNARVAALGFQPYSTLNLVTPGITGLAYPAVMQALRDEGVRYVVTDTSQPGSTCGVTNASCDNPTPNAGLYSPLQPEILMIPRRPTNLYFDVSTPDQWVAEYNNNYRTYWGRDLTYAEILGKESDVLLSYLLKGDNDPWMFHQGNLRDFDGSGHSLLSDLLDQTFAKYDALMRAPMVSPTMEQLGVLVASRMQQDASGVVATIGPGATITVNVAQAARVSVTGACPGSSGGAATLYAGQPIARADVAPGTSVILPVAAGSCSPTGGSGGADGQGGAGGGGSGLGGSGSGGAISPGTGGNSGSGGIGAGGMATGAGGDGSGGAAVTGVGGATGEGGMGMGGSGSGGAVVVIGVGGAVGTGGMGTGGMGTGGSGSGGAMVLIGVGGAVGTGGMGTGGSGVGGAMVTGVGGATGEGMAGGAAGDGGGAGAGPGGGANGAGGAVASDAGSSDGASTLPAITPPGGGGCGCDVSSGVPAPLSGLTLVGLILIARARTRRRPGR